MDGVRRGDDEHRRDDHQGGAEQAQDRVAGRGHDHARAQAGRGRRAPDQRVGEALQAGPLGERQARGSAARTRRRTPGSSRTRAGTGRGTGEAALGRRGRRQHRGDAPASPSRRGSPARCRSGRSAGPTPATARTSRTCGALITSPMAAREWPCSVMWSGVIVMIRTITTWPVTSATIATGTCGRRQHRRSDTAVDASARRGSGATSRRRAA